jgi:mycothiol synthase
MTQGVSVSTVESLNTTQQEDVLEIINAAYAIDKVSPLSEHVELHLKHGGDKPISHILITQNSKVIGYGHLDQTDLVEGPSAEIVVHPDQRNKGIAKLIIEQIESQLGEKPLRLWARGDTTEANNFALSLGYSPIRNILQMRRSLLSTLSDFEINKKFVLTTFQGEKDSQDILNINKNAFINLPDQAAWSISDLNLRIKEDWFDPNGLAILRTTTNQPVGFCWTKVHGHHSHGHQPIGELYVLAVINEFQGQGLGKHLTLWGLHHLRSLDLSEAMLYVDANNENAKKIYTELGFQYAGSDTLYKSLT